LINNFEATKPLTAAEKSNFDLLEQKEKRERQKEEKAATAK